MLQSRFLAKNEPGQHDAGSCHAQNFAGLLPSLMILWLTLPLMCLPSTLEKSVPPRYGEHQDPRCEAYTTSILFQLRVIETLPLGQGLCPAIALLGLVLFVLVRRFLFKVVTIDLFQETHSSADNRQRALAVNGAWILSLAV